VSGSFSNDSRLKRLFKVANARLNGLALAYIQKPTEIDSSSVLKRWDASGHRRIASASLKNKRRAKNFHISNHES